MPFRISARIPPCLYEAGTILLFFAEAYFSSFAPNYTPSESAQNFDLEGLLMKNQTIHCSVSSCRHHNTQNGCDLSAINVCANCNCHSGKSDESMCGSYECGCK